MKHKTIIVLGSGFLLACTIGFLVVFMAAYFNTNKSACIDINHFGEANIELVMCILLFPFSVLAINLLINYGVEKELDDDEKKGCIK